MLTSRNSKKKERPSRSHRRERKLWNNSQQNPPSLGCLACPDLATCGGLHVERSFYHCLDSCCSRPETCDVVCRNNPQNFTHRIREVGGFQLENVPRAEKLPLPRLPTVAPIVFHGNRRESSFEAPMLSLPLYKVIPRNDGTERFLDAAAVATAFRFNVDTPLILTGIADDRPLERWWSLGPKRLEAIRKLKAFGVVLVTTPNFSLFTDQPRWDDMYSMKRIALTHEEFLRIGIPAALHVNARTERDWGRWIEYIQQRNEVTHIAFEFRTGAGWARRVGWQVAQLCELANSVGRPIHLVVRAAPTQYLPRLISAFGNTTVLETSSFIKTVHRQMAIASTNGTVAWSATMTPPGTPLDQLLAHNWSIVKESYRLAFDSALSRCAAE